MKPKLALIFLVLCPILLGLVFTSCGNGQSAPPPTANFSASPASLNNFVSLANPPTSQTQSLTISNSGNAALQVTAINVSGANASDFSLSPPAPLSVAPGSNTVLHVTFKPTASGQRTASLTFTDNAASSPQTVPLAGTGTMPILANLQAVQFGTQVVNSGTTQTAVVNTGNGDLIISNVAIAGPSSGDFSLSGTIPLTVHPQDSVDVTFKPTASGARSATLTLTDNASGSPQTISLSGTGVLQGPTQASDAWVLFNPNTFSATTFPTTVAVTINGTDTTFAAGATEANFGPGGAVSDGTSTGVPGEFGLVQVTGPTTATAQVTFDSTAAPGPRFAIVMTDGHPSIATFVVPAHGGPVANAGIPQVVSVGQTVQLDGSGSSAQAGVQLTSASLTTNSTTSSPLLSYQWSLLSAPQGSAATIDGNSVRTSFVPDQPGNYLIQLAVTDASGNTTANWVMVSTALTPPVASAGADQFVAVGATVQLDGSGSIDPSGNSLTYSWNFISVPTGSTAQLSSQNAVAPTFVADLGACLTKDWKRALMRPRVCWLIDWTSMRLLMLLSIVPGRSGSLPAA